MNALAAATTACALDISYRSIVAGLSGFAGVKGRLQRKPALHGSTFIDDTYNANPDSVKAALAVLAQQPGKKMLVLGDMGELGEDAAAMHAQIGLAARAAGVDRLLALGDLTKETVGAFGSGAMHFERIQELLAELENALTPDTTVLVKGSRFMQMERVVNSFMESTRRPRGLGTRHTDMLLWLFQQLGQDIRAFNVFNYLTLRAVMATLTALSISFIVGPAVIRKLTA